LNPQGRERTNAGLVEQRIAAVRNALIKEGVPPARIETGAFRENNMVREGQFAVMVRTQR
jgi:outer membrane protein OmpA-like peptidoglycan-associated protein